MHGVFGDNSKKSPPKYTRENIGYIPKDQLIFDGKWLLDRLSPTCEGCSNTNGYSIFKDTYTQFLSKTQNYVISCIDCDFFFELEYDEYLKIEKLAKLNQKYRDEELGDSEYINRLDKEIEKIRKRL